MRRPWIWLLLVGVSALWVSLAYAGGGSFQPLIPVDAPKTGSCLLDGETFDVEWDESPNAELYFVRVRRTTGPDIIMLVREPRVLLALALSPKLQLTIRGARGATGRELSADFLALVCHE